MPGQIGEQKFEGTQIIHETIPDQIISAYYAVYNELGHGFLEKVYENALAIELRRRGLTVKQQLPVAVFYQGEIVGEYFADLLIENCVIIELKAADRIADKHSAQLMNYLKATDVEVGLVLNFGDEPKFVRKIFTNDRKQVRDFPPVAE